MFALLGAIVCLLLAGRFEIFSWSWISLLTAGIVLELVVFQDQLIKIREAEEDLESAQNRIEDLLEVAEFTLEAVEMTVNESRIVTFDNRETKKLEQVHEKIDNIKEDN